MLPRSAGILVPLFSMRSENDLGRGEIAHIRAMIDLAVQMGHRVIQILPLDETAPDESSPYSALSPFAIDPLYVSLDQNPASDIRGSKDSSPSRASFAELKRELLEKEYAGFRARSEQKDNRLLDDFIAEQSWWLDDYTLFRALKDRFDFLPWEKWPAELANREPSAIAAARQELAVTIRKYAYYQLLAHSQWREIRGYAHQRGVLIGGDLAFSASRDSDVVWANREDYDLPRMVGAPPDAFSADGQRWGLPMPNWPHVRAGGFKLWRARVRHASQMFDLMRIDHVVGLYRTFAFGPDEAFPGEFSPADEGDQRAQGQSLIAAFKQEAPEVVFIAEDLGTIPPWVRASLTALGLPGYKVIQWEREWDKPGQPFVLPANYPELSLVTTGTHDTETFIVWWSGLAPEERMNLCRSLRLEDRIDPQTTMGIPALDAVIETLYAAPSRLTLMPIQDLFGWPSRINTPGTVGEGNWSWRLPLTFERMSESPSIQARIAYLRDLALRTGRFSI